MVDDFSDDGVDAVLSGGDENVFIGIAARIGEGVGCSDADHDVTVFVVDAVRVPSGMSGAADVGVVFTGWHS